MLKGSYIYGASQQSSRIQGLPDGLEHVGRGVFQLVNFCNPTGEILKTFCGGTSRQSFITSIHSEWEISILKWILKDHVTDDAENSALASQE